MILDRLRMTPSEIHEATGWEIKPEGACQGTVCVPVRDLDLASDGTLAVDDFAARMDMPMVGDAAHGAWALGPRVAGTVLESAAMPDLQLPDFDGDVFDLATLRGRKVVLVAWASW